MNTMTSITAIKRERECRRRRVVGLLQVQGLDDVADHRLLGAAQELGVDVVAGRRDEREQRPGDDPGTESGSVTRRNAWREDA